MPTPASAAVSTPATPAGSTSPQPAADWASAAPQWRGLSWAERSRVRRLVRMGRPVDPELAHLAAAYAALQRSRPWFRVFWLWFVPGLVVALAAAASIHPVAIGVVLALAAQSVMAWRNLRRA